MTTASPAGAPARLKRCLAFVDDHEARAAVSELVRVHWATPEQVIAKLAPYEADHARVVRALVAVAADLQRRIAMALDAREELDGAFTELAGVVGREIKLAEDQVADLFATLTDEGA